MFKYLEIRNYESHKKTILNFHPGVNVIVGDNDIGKSALFRIIEWIWKNRPLDLGFRPKGIDPKEITRGTLGLMDGNVITKERSNSINRYIINNEKPLTGFDKKVPDEVIKLLNMDDINIQPQMSSFFLLSNSSGEVARYLNNITNLDDIDVVQAYVKKEKNQISTKLLNKKINLGVLEEQLGDFDLIDFYENKIQELEDLEKKSNQLKNVKRQVEDISRNINIKIKSLSKYKDFYLYKNKVEKLEKLYKGYKKRDDILKDYNLLIKKDRKAHKLLSIYKTISKNNSKVIELSELYEKSKEIIQKKYMVKERCDDIHNIINQLAYKKKVLKTIKNNLKEYNEKYNVMMGDECPLCGSEIKGDDNE